MFQLAGDNLFFLLFFGIWFKHAELLQCLNFLLCSMVGNLKLKAFKVVLYHVHTPAFMCAGFETNYMLWDNQKITRTLLNFNEVTE